MVDASRMWLGSRKGVWVFSFPFHLWEVPEFQTVLRTQTLSKTSVKSETGAKPYGYNNEQDRQNDSL